MVIFNQEFQDMPRDPCANRVQVPVDLRIVRIFVAGEIAPKKESGDQQQDDSYNKKHAESEDCRHENSSSEDLCPTQATEPAGLPYR